MNILPADSVGKWTVHVCGDRVSPLSSVHVAGSSPAKINPKRITVNSREMYKPHQFHTTGVVNIIITYLFCRNIEQDQRLRGSEIVQSSPKANFKLHTFGGVTEFLWTRYFVFDWFPGVYSTRTLCQKKNLIFAFGNVFLHDSICYCLALPPSFVSANKKSTNAKFQSSKAIQWFNFFFSNLIKWFLGYFQRKYTSLFNRTLPTFFPYISFA